jgi:transposase
MSRDKKMDVIRRIESSGLSISQALKKQDMPRSTYYRWKHKLRTLGLQGLKDNKPHRARTWNQLLPQAAHNEVQNIMRIKNVSPYTTSTYIDSGAWIRTRDLRVMSPTSYQTALPRNKLFRTKTPPVTLTTISLNAKVFHKFSSRLRPHDRVHIHMLANG